MKGFIDENFSNSFLCLEYMGYIDISQKFLKYFRFKNMFYFLFELVKKSVDFMGKICKLLILRQNVLKLQNVFNKYRFGCLKIYKLFILR